MPKYCHVKVMFEIRLLVEPFEEMPQSTENNEKLKEVERMLFKKMPDLMNCSNVRIIECKEGS